jgi:tetratricopeptide (TPR) repeat protein
VTVTLRATSVQGASVVLLLLAVSALGVARLQPRLARAVHGIKQRDDVHALPPADQLKHMTLGHDAAVVDLLWAKLLVEYGTHSFEKRPFPDLPRYLDAILALEPDYEPLWRYVDTLIVYRPPVGTEADARLARAYLERGIVARPHDHRMWKTYGQFIAFIAPSFLTSREEIDRWKQDGAHALVHAVELGASSNASISAATILSKGGERDAAIHYLQRAYAITDDPAERDAISLKLEALAAKANDDSAERAVTFVESRWRATFPFLTRGEFLLVGPSPDPLRCVGLDSESECARDWGPLLPSAPESAP